MTAMKCWSNNGGREAFCSRTATHILANLLSSSKDIRFSDGKAGPLHMLMNPIPTDSPFYAADTLVIALSAGR